MSGWKLPAAPTDSCLFTYLCSSYMDQNSRQQERPEFPSNPAESRKIRKWCVAGYTQSAVCIHLLFTPLSFCVGSWVNRIRWEMSMSFYCAWCVTPEYSYEIMCQLRMHNNRTVTGIILGVLHLGHSPFLCCEYFITSRLKKKKKKKPNCGLAWTDKTSIFNVSMSHQLLLKLMWLNKGLAIWGS